MKILEEGYIQYEVGDRIKSLCGCNNPTCPGKNRQGFIESVDKYNRHFRILWDSHDVISGPYVSREYIAPGDPIIDGMLIKDIET